MTIDPSQCSPAGASVFITLILAAVFIVIFLVRHNRAIRTPLFSVESKAAVVSEDRGLLNNQIRNAENYTGTIERIIGCAFVARFKDLNDDQKSECLLLANVIRRAIDKQILFDLLTNHIVDKTRDELDVYIKSKSDGHILRIYNFVHNYNDSVLPDKNLALAIDDVDKKDFYDCFSGVYKSAVMFAGKSIE